MKRLCYLLPLLSCLAFAQATFTIPAVAGNEQSLSLTESATAVSNVITYIQTTGPNNRWPNSASAIPGNTTLGAAITTAGQTSITLTSGANLQTCNGLQIGTETMQIVSMAGNVATVLRGLIGTTATTYSNGAEVSVLRVGGGTCLIKAFLADEIQKAVASQLQGASITAQTAAISAANASIATTIAAAVQ